MFLLDTFVLSEMRKRRPGANGVRWLKAKQEATLFLSVVSPGEIERGIEKQRRENVEFPSELSRWLETLQNLCADRILHITAPIARRWGVLSAQLGHDGVDLLIAATALTHNLTVVTRNTKHFEPARVKLVNPFD